MKAIGIDFGTTNTCVAVFRDGEIEVIPNEHGNRSTPSYVTFTNTQHLIGESAVDAVISNPQNTVFGLKCLIGRRFNSRNVQSYISLLPYQVVENNGKLEISVEYKGVRRTFEPEEITGMILGKMKDISELYLGVAVEKCVITVPTCFDIPQWEAMIKAASIAGLEVLQIMSETTAAVYAFGLHRNVSHERNILIFHLGGYSTNVSIITINKNCRCDIKATTGSMMPGINNFIRTLAEGFARDFSVQYGVHITGNQRVLRRLTKAAESAITQFSSCTEATICEDSLCDGKNYFRTVTRALFEEFCSDLFGKMMLYVQQALELARIPPSDIYRVILMGGGTKMVKIQNMMIEQFGGRILTTANPDEVAASGAAIQAALLSHDSIEKIENFLLLNLVPLSLGVEICKGIMLVVVERNTPVPCTKSNVVTTYEDNQTELAIKIYEGERTRTIDNNMLGILILNGITPAPRGVAKIEVMFKVSANGVLVVQATDLTSGSSRHIIIRNKKRLNSLQIRRNIVDSQEFSECDKLHKCRLEARDALESFVYKVRRVVANDTSVLTKTERELMHDEFEDAFNWLNENFDSEDEDFWFKQMELSLNWSTFMNKFNQPVCRSSETSVTSDNSEYQFVSHPGPIGMQQQRERKPDRSGDMLKNMR